MRGIPAVRSIGLRIAVMVFAGCAARPVFREPDATWQTAAGQLQYTTRSRSIIGEFTLSHRADEFRLEFSKAGGVPLLKIARSGGKGFAEGPLARGRWSGPVETAPMPLRAWLNDVPEMVTRPADRLDLPGAEPGEKFVFIFNQ